MSEEKMCEPSFKKMARDGDFVYWCPAHNLPSQVCFFNEKEARLTSENASLRARVADLEHAGRILFNAAADMDRNFNGIRWGRGNFSDQERWDKLRFAVEQYAALPSAGKEE